MIFYPFTLVHLILPYNVRLFNYSQAVVVPMGRLIHGVMSIVLSFYNTRYVRKKYSLKQSLLLTSRLA